MVHGGQLVNKTTKIGVQTTTLLLYLKHAVVLDFV